MPGEIISEHRARSNRNGGRHHRGFAGDFPRNPQLLVKKAFDRGFIDRHVLGFDHFEEDLRRGIDHPGEPRLPDDRDSTLFGDTIEELSGWYCFSEQYRVDQER
jgi:hypothetical protein